RGPSGQSLPVTFALTCLIAVLIDPHLVDYDLTVLVAAGIVAAALVPRYTLIILPLYLATLLRVQIPLGEASLQLTAPFLLVLLAWSAYEARPIRARTPTVEPVGPAVLAHH